MTAPTTSPDPAVTPAPAADDERVDRTWTYLGQRLTGAGTLTHGWLTHLDTEVYFDLKGSFGAVGSRYTVACSADGGRLISGGPRAPRFTDRGDRDDPRVQAWAAAHRTDTTLYEVQRAEKRSKGEPDALTLALAPLREAYRKRIGHARRAAFLAMVLEEITR